MNIYQKFEHIDTLVFDVDGIFTNGDVLVTEQGELLRSVSTRDGLAIKLAIKAGLNVAIISGGNSKGVKKRFEGLGVTHIYMGIEDKLPIMKKILESFGTSAKSAAYMGDDIPDVPVLKYVNLPACPIDAVNEVIESSEYISQQKGGTGCVRDFVEKVMRSQGLWPVF